MRITCPHCRTSYEVDRAPIEAVFVCFRCHGRFRAADSPAPSGEHAAHPPEEQLPLFTREGASRTEAPAGSRDHHLAHEDLAKGPEAAPASPPAAAPEPQASADAAEEAPGLDANAAAEPWPVPPERQSRIWLWLVAVLLALGIGGFLAQKDAWLDNRWVRSQLHRLHLPVAFRDKDWYVIPESVRAEWIERNDGSRALLIQGRVRNLLDVPAPPPKIEVVFFSTRDPEGIADDRKMEITEPPSLERIGTAPYRPPPLDIVPVNGGDERGFVLVVENLPRDAGDFTLLPRARQRL